MEGIWHDKEKRVCIGHDGRINLFRNIPIIEFMSKRTGALCALGIDILISPTGRFMPCNNSKKALLQHIDKCLPHKDEVIAPNNVSLKFWIKHSWPDIESLKGTGEKNNYPIDAALEVEDRMFDVVVEGAESVYYYGLMRSDAATLLLDIMPLFATAIDIQRMFAQLEEILETAHDMLDNDKPKISDVYDFEKRMIPNYLGRE